MTVPPSPPPEGPGTPGESAAPAAPAIPAESAVPAAPAIPAESAVPAAPAVRDIPTPPRGVPGAVPPPAGPTDRAASAAPPGAPAPGSPGAPDGARQILRDGVDVLRDAGRLVARYWAPLVAIAALAVVGRHLMLNLAVLTAPVNNILGLLVFSLVPIVSLTAIVGMLLVLRRPGLAEHDDADADAPPGRRVRRTTGMMLAALSSVLVPFLLIYEYAGTLRDDRGRYFYDALTIRMDAAYDENLQLSEDFDAAAHIPEVTSFTTLGTIAAALVIRFVGNRILKARAGDDPKAWTWLRLIVGYAEVVWMVLGVMLVVAVTRGAQEWWRERAVAVQLAGWWDGVVVDLPAVGTVAGAIVAFLITAIGAAILGIAIPIAWLTIGTVVYGVRADRIVDDPTTVIRGRLGALTGRITDARSEQVRRAWAAILHPESRFGALTGGIGLVLAAGWMPALLFCAAFLLVQRVDHVVWWLAGLVLPTAERTDWIALYPSISALAWVITQVLAIALLASAADALLRRFGARRALRLPSPATAGSTATPPPPPPDAVPVPLPPPPGYGPAPTVTR